MKDFYDYGLRRNMYLWFHMLAGGLFGLFIDPLKVFGLAIGWEMVELLFSGKNNIVKNYGSVKVFLYDSLGDIVGAVIMAMLVFYARGGF